MIQHTLLIIFLIVSASGATIIVSKGDIFSWFRDGLKNLSEKNKVWIHDAEINSTVLKILFDDEVYEGLGDKGTPFLELHENHKHSARTEYKNGRTRYFLEFKEKHKIEFVVKNQLVDIKAAVYERHDKIGWIDFLHQMWSCPQCAGTWVGFLWYIIASLYGWINFNLFLCLSFGCTVSFIAYMYFKIYSFLEKK